MLTLQSMPEKTLSFLLYLILIWMEFTHPEARCKAVNPYFSDFRLSQELILPQPPRYQPRPALTFKLEPTKARPRLTKQSRARPTQLPRHAKDLYDFVQ